MPQLLRSCHLEPTLAVTAITTALAVSAGRGVGAVWVALAVLAGQLSVGWSNDYLDRDRDRASGRLDKPLATGGVSARAVGTCAVVALVASVPLSLASGPPATAVHLTAIAAAWAYNLGGKATVVSVVPYAVSFGLLPAFVTLGLPGHPAPPPWAVLAGALLGAGAHFINALPDLESDAATGVRGLPHRLGSRGSLAAGVLLLAGAAGAIALGPPHRKPVGYVGFGLTLLTVAAVVVAARREGSRGAFRLTLVVAGLAVGMLLAQGHSLTQ